MLEGTLSAESNGIVRALVLAIFGESSRAPSFCIRFCIIARAISSIGRKIVELALSQRQNLVAT